MTSPRQIIHYLAVGWAILNTGMVGAHTERHAVPVICALLRGGIGDEAD